jgi:hypothetical protein
MYGTGEGNNVHIIFDVLGHASWSRQTGEAIEDLKLTGPHELARQTSATCKSDPFLYPPTGVSGCTNVTVLVDVKSGPLYDFYQQPKKFLMAQSSPVDLAVSLSKKHPASNVPPPPPPKPEAPAQPAPAGKAMSSPKKAGTASFEAESLLAQGQVHVQGGQVTAQPMQGFGNRWSGNSQLFWFGGGAGAVLDLDVNVPVPGSYEVILMLTRAPDYGTLRVQVQGADAALVFDGFASGVTGPVMLKAGVFPLVAGTRQVSLMILGKNPASTGFLAGIDRIVLQPAN